MMIKLPQKAKMLGLWTTAVFLALIGLTNSTNIALAHTRVEVGPYAFVIGWLQEPPIVGERKRPYP